jgi:hypothetical protein
MEAADLKEFSWCSTNNLCIIWRQLTWRSIYCMRAAAILQRLSVSDGGSWPEGAGTAWEQLLYYKNYLYQMEAAYLKKIVAGISW